jgi:hypothetical protein
MYHSKDTAFGSIVVLVKLTVKGPQPEVTSAVNEICALIEKNVNMGSNDESI